MLLFAPDVKSVTSPKGLHGWKHRFAVDRGLSRGLAGPAGPKPMGFGSIGLHGVRIGSIRLQSCGLLVDCKQKKNNSAVGVSATDGVEPYHFARFCKDMGPIPQTYG
jgi:hypothetical protein